MGAPRQIVQASGEEVGRRLALAREWEEAARDTLEIAWRQVERSTRSLESARGRVKDAESLLGETDDDDDDDDDWTDAEQKQPHRAAAAALGKKNHPKQQAAPANSGRKNLRGRALALVAGTLRPRKDGKKKSGVESKIGVDEGDANGDDAKNPEDDDDDDEGLVTQTVDWRRVRNSGRPLSRSVTVTKASRSEELVTLARKGTRFDDPTCRDGSANRGRVDSRRRKGRSDKALFSKSSTHLDKLELKLEREEMEREENGSRRTKSSRRKGGEKASFSKSSTHLDKLELKLKREEMEREENSSRRAKSFRRIGGDKASFSKSSTHLDKLELKLEREEREREERMRRKSEREEGEKLARKLERENQERKDREAKLQRIEPEMRSELDCLERLAQKLERDKMERRLETGRVRKKRSDGVRKSVVKASKSKDERPRACSKSSSLERSDSLRRPRSESRSSETDDKKLLRRKSCSKRISLDRNDSPRKSRSEGRSSKRSDSSSRKSRSRSVSPERDGEDSSSRKSRSKSSSMERDDEGSCRKSRSNSESLERDGRDTSSCKSRSKSRGLERDRGKNPLERDDRGSSSRKSRSNSSRSERHGEDSSRRKSRSRSGSLMLGLERLDRKLERDKAERRAEEADKETKRANRRKRSAGNRNSMVEASRSKEERPKHRRSRSEGRSSDRDDEDSSSRKSRSEDGGLAGDDEDSSVCRSRSKSGGLDRKDEGSLSRKLRSKSNGLEGHDEDPTSRKPRSKSCSLENYKSGSLERGLESIDSIRRSRSEGRSSRRDYKDLCREFRSKSSSLERVDEDSSGRKSRSKSSSLERDDTDSLSRVSRLKSSSRERHDGGSSRREVRSDGNGPERDDDDPRPKSRSKSRGLEMDGSKCDDKRASERRLGGKNGRGPSSGLRKSRKGGRRSGHGLKESKTRSNEDFSGDYIRRLASEARDHTSTASSTDSPLRGLELLGESPSLLGEMCDNLSVSSPELGWCGRDSGGGESKRATPGIGKCPEGQGVICSNESKDSTLKSGDRRSSRKFVEAVEENSTGREKNDRPSGRKLVGKTHSSDEAIALAVIGDGGDSRHGESTAVRHSGKEFGNKDPYGRGVIRDERYNLSTRDQTATRLAKSIRSDEAVVLSPTCNGSDDSGDGEPKERIGKDPSDQGAVRDGCYHPSTRDPSATILTKSIRSDEAVALSVSNNGDDRSGAALHSTKELGDEEPSGRDVVRDGCYDLSTRDRSATGLAKSIRSDEAVALSATGDDRSGENDEDRSGRSTVGGGRRDRSSTPDRSATRRTESSLRGSSKSAKVRAAIGVARSRRHSALTRPGGGGMSCASDQELTVSNSTVTEKRSGKGPGARGT